MFFTCGGSESVEAAWKLVRQYHLANGEPQRTKAIARDVAYHGVTLGALALTGVERFKTPFGPPAIDTRHVSSTTTSAPAPSRGASCCAALLDEIEQAILDEGPETVAAIIAEPRAERRRLPRRPRPATGRGCARSPTATGSCWSPTR